MIPPDATHHDGRAYLRLDTDGWAVWVDGAWRHLCDAAEITAWARTPVPLRTAGVS